MTLYVKLNENNEPIEWPVGFARIKHDNPNTSFPSVTDNLDVSSYGFAKFVQSEVPEHNSLVQELTEVAPVINSNGVYEQTWEVSEKYGESEKATILAEAETELNNNKATVMRQYRDMLMSETDHWVLSDTPDATAEQLAYRQALRDITSHANFPNLEDADWPTKP